LCDSESNAGASGGDYRYAAFETATHEFLLLLAGSRSAATVFLPN
jgi:hypothetical protein